MVGGKLKVVWSDDAREQLRAAYNYIKKDSLQNAKNVRLDITEMTRKYGTEKLLITFQFWPKYKFLLFVYLLHLSKTGISITHIRSL